MGFRFSFQLHFSPLYLVSKPKEPLSVLSAPRSTPLLGEFEHVHIFTCPFHNLFQLHLALNNFSTHSWFLQKYDIASIVIYTQQYPGIYSWVNLLPSIMFSTPGTTLGQFYITAAVSWINAGNQSIFANQFDSTRVTIVMLVITNWPH